MIAVMQSDLVRRHRLTVEEYFRMAEVGLLAPDARVELIQGEIFDMAPIGNLHGGFTSWLHRRLLRDLGEQISVWSRDEYKDKRPTPDDVLLIVEVSQGSLNHDRQVKVPLYAQHGIPEVWLLDVERRRIRFFQNPQAAQYTHTSHTPTPGRVSLLALPGAAVDLTGLFED